MSDENKQQFAQNSSASGGLRRTEPDLAGLHRSRPVMTVDPDDDDYVFTAQAACVFAANRGIKIRDRRYRRVCDRNDSNVLKCIWKRVGNIHKPQWYIGANSLDEFVTNEMQNRAMAAQESQHGKEPVSAGQPRPPSMSTNFPESELATAERTEDMRPTKEEIERLQDALDLKEVDIRVKDELLKQERALRREDMRHVAEMGEQIGSLKQQNKQLQLKAPDEHPSRSAIDAEFSSGELSNSNQPRNVTILET